MLNGASVTATWTATFPPSSPRRLFISQAINADREFDFHHSLEVFQTQNGLQPQIILYSTEDSTQYKNDSIIPLPKSLHFTVNK